MEKRFILGIDLGTTNSSVAYIDLERKNIHKHQIHKFKIPQLIGPKKISFLEVLPSFLYIPGDYDIAPKDMLTPWKIEQRNREDKNFPGLFAKNHESKVLSRLVSSAKNWFYNKHINKRARVLPWESDKNVFKISPIQESASYLKHIRKAWNVLRRYDD